MSWATKAITANASATVESVSTFLIDATTASVARHVSAIVADPTDNAASGTLKNAPLTYRPWSSEAMRHGFYLQALAPCLEPQQAASEQPRLVPSPACRAGDLADISRAF